MPIENFDYTRVTESLKLMVDPPDMDNTALRVQDSEAFMACYIAFPEMMEEWEMSIDHRTGENSGDTTPVNQDRPRHVDIDEDLMTHNTDEVVFFKYVYHALETVAMDAAHSDVAVGAKHNKDVWKKEWT